MITSREIYNTGLLSARPKDADHTSQVATGLQPLKLDSIKDGVIYIPGNYNHNVPASLAVMLHGAGGIAEHGLGLLRHYADNNNIILLAPASRATTWDIIAKDTFNGDVIFINQALSMVFERFNINGRHIAIGGFSDGASYALSLGLSNGDLFTHIIAFSPGFYHTFENKGKPAIFISHGVKDRTLPIAPCSRRIVPRLKRLNYDVHYEEFQGEHEIPTAITVTAIDWFMKSPTSS